MGKQVETCNIYLKIQVWTLGRNQWTRGIDLELLL